MYSILFVLSMLYANVGIDFSRGNASNWTAPGLVRSKIGTIRKSYHFSGNAKDYVAQFELPLKEGSKTKLWMDYEEYRHMLKFKEECEMSKSLAIALQETPDQYSSRIRFTCHGDVLVRYFLPVQYRTGAGSGGMYGGRIK